MVNERQVKFRVKPYFQEAMLQFFVDILVTITLFAVFLIVGFPLDIVIVTTVVYLAIAIPIHYTTICKAIIDRQKKEYITEVLQIERFINEFSLLGDRLGHSNLRFFYPTAMQVDKYRIKTITSCGENKTLRSVLSFKRLLEFAVLEKKEARYFKVTYLKRSKILLTVDLVEPVQLKKKQQREILKALDIINKSI